MAAATLAQSNVTVHLTAFGMQGQSAQMQLADFSSGTIENYNLAGTTPTSYANFMGYTFNPKDFENRFYAG